MSTQYLSLEALAAELYLPKTFLRRLVDKDEIPYLDVGGRKRFNADSVHEALTEIATKSERRS